jgi:hypothetical protein
MLDRLKMEHRYEAKYSTPFNRSAGAVSSVTADLNSLEVLIAQFTFGLIDHISGKVPVLLVGLA